MFGEGEEEEAYPRLKYFGSMGYDILLKVRPPLAEEAKDIKEGSTVISFLYPAQNKGIVDTLASRQVSAFAVGNYLPHNSSRCSPGELDRWI